MMPILKSTEQAVGGKWTETDNLRLLFDRYVTGWTTDRKTGTPWAFNNELGGKFMEQVEARARKLAVAEKDYASHFVPSWRSTLAGIEGTELFTAKTAWRLALGLGNETVLENGVTFHPVWGVPYIPGSSLKGVCRAHFIETRLAPEAPGENLNALDALIGLVPREATEKNVKQASGECRKDNEVRLLATLAKILAGWDAFKLAQRLFGGRDHEGDVAWFDAMPTRIPAMKTDIINCHYPRWYQSGEAPGDWMNPVPVKFLVVDEKQEFLFAVGPVRKGAPVEEAATLLAEALETRGVGAKTAVNYGYFTAVDRTSAKRAVEERRKAEAEARATRELEALPAGERLRREVEAAAAETVGEIFVRFEKEIPSLSPDEQKAVAAAFKTRMQAAGRWRQKRNKKGELDLKDKDTKRTARIMELLGRN